MSIQLVTRLLLKVCVCLLQAGTCQIIKVVAAMQEGTMVTLKPKAAASGAWASQKSWGQPDNGAADGQDDDLARAIAASLGQDAGMAPCQVCG